MAVKVDRLHSRLAGREILQDIRLQAQPGELVGLIGPNGSGKSTLLKHIYRLLRPDAGAVYLDDENVHAMPSREVARKLAVVSQEAPMLFDFSVEEIVAMGRSPHKRWLEPDSRTDREIVERCLEQVDMLDFRESDYASLSGGEKQRVLIARSLAQEADMLVLDEPTNHLDIHHQLQILDLVKRLRFTAIAALHDLNLAAAYCDRLYVIDGGKIVKSGPPAEVLTKELLRDVFRVEAEVMIHPRTAKVNITYVSHWIDKNENHGGMET